MPNLLITLAALSSVVPGPTVPLATSGASAPVEVKIIAFNDFHGALEPPKLAVDAPAPGEGATRVPAGGVAYFASAIDSLRAANPNHAVVSAGDMFGGSPSVSALFLEEPTIHAMNLIGLDFNVVGNHELDHGFAELLRLQKGGCEKHGRAEPCRVEPFRGARFDFLSANILTASGETLFLPYRIRTFGDGARRVRVAFIGMTPKTTPTLVNRAGVAGLTFQDEADTANELVRRLRAEGVETIVLLIHQNAVTRGGYNDQSCDGLTGDLLPILDRLDPEIDLVISGHHHRAYVCDYGRINPSRPFLLTGAGPAGMYLTDIDLQIDPTTGDVTSKRADNIIVQGEGFTGPRGKVPVSDRYPRFPRHPGLAALVDRYATAAEPLLKRTVGRLTGQANRTQTSAGEQVLGDLIADAYLAATRTRDKGGAQIAFVNAGSIRADLVPGADGSVTFGQLIAANPLGSTLVVKSFTGRQIRDMLEQQFASVSLSFPSPNILMPSANFRYAYDLSRPQGQRILSPTVGGEPLRDDAVYRVATSEFLAGGGDNFTVLTEGTDPIGGVQDVEALEFYMSAPGPIAPPVPDRIANRTPG